MILDGSDDIRESTKILRRLDNMWATCQRRFTADWRARYPYDRLQWQGDISHRDVELWMQC